jgi:hypothetical protein
MTVNITIKDNVFSGLNMAYGYLFRLLEVVSFEITQLNISSILIVAIDDTDPVDGKNVLITSNIIKMKDCTIDSLPSGY